MRTCFVSDCAVVTLRDRAFGRVLKVGSDLLSGRALWANPQWDQGFTTADDFWKAGACKSLGFPQSILLLRHDHRADMRDDTSFCSVLLLRENRAAGLLSGEKAVLQASLRASDQPVAATKKGWLWGRSTDCFVKRPLACACGIRGRGSK